MIKVKVYSSTGRKLADKALPKRFEEKENLKLLAQAIHVYRARAYPGTSKVKTRGEVNLTGAKWYRQKGTGRARHGDKGAPIFVGGGIAHGPKGVKRQLVLPKKMITKALNITLSMKAKEGKIVLVDKLNSLKKTKEAQDLLRKIFPEKGLRVTFCLSNENFSLKKVLGNLKNVEVTKFTNLNAYKVYFGGNLLIDSDIFNKRKKVKNK